MNSQKKLSILPAKQDVSSLNDAVSELAKRTEALLGGNSSSETPRPKLPKKHVKKKIPQHHQSRPKSFDIIHNPKKGMKTKALLKGSPEVKVSKSLLQTEASPVVIPHKGSLVIPSPVEEEPEVKAAVSTHHIHEASTVNEQAKPQADTEVSSEPSEKEPVKLTEEEPAEDSPSRADAEAKVTFESGEIASSNLVKKTAAKGYEPHENQATPAIFDTNEYHVSLHDWSKLDHTQSQKWYILALLLVIAGALAYILFFR